MSWMVSEIFLHDFMVKFSDKFSMLGRCQLNDKYKIRLMALKEINTNQYIFYTTLEDGKTGFLLVSATDFLMTD